MKSISVTRAVRSAALVALATFIVAAPTNAQADPADASPTPATTLSDLSGLAVVDADHLVAVHDAKNPGELDRSRVSLLTRTHAEDGITWEAVTVDWPEDIGPASDLESASSVPGSPLLLLAESGDDGSDFQRLFLVEIDRTTSPPAATVVGVTTWPDPAFNVEGMAVGSVDDALVLLYAERAEGASTTPIKWAALSLEPFAVGASDEAAFTSPAARGPGDRPVTAIEVSSRGLVYVASAYDSGEDDGPFSSSVWLAGRLVGGAEGPRLRLRERPRRLAVLDAFKVESLASVPVAGRDDQLLAGTDDENYGGALRPLRR